MKHSGALMFHRLWTVVDRLHEQFRMAISVQPCSCISAFTVSSLVATRTLKPGREECNKLGSVLVSVRHSDHEAMHVLTLS